MTNDQGERERVVDALLRLAEARHSLYLPDSSLDQVRGAVESLRSAVDALNAYPLTNGDEPDQLFTVYRDYG